MIFENAEISFPFIFFKLNLFSLRVSLISGYCFVKSFILRIQRLEKCLLYLFYANIVNKVLITIIINNRGFVWESMIPRSTLVHDLFSIEVEFVSLRSRILISIAIKS